ncbi:MAG: hypothetical protein JO240_10125 [Solirubrobacterales bacterium]|nr:hypothetical protein [Solirubrobacterales bacterium]
MEAQTMPAQTNTEARERADEATGNGQQSEATREQIREDQHRFGQAQDSYRQKVEHQADEVQQQLQKANQTGRQAVGEYVRALTRGYQAFIPQAVIDPRQAIDFAADFIVQTTELQRSVLHELVGAGQLNARAASRAAADLSDDR